MVRLADGPEETPRGREEPIPEATWCRIEELLRHAQRARREPVTVETPDPAAREVLEEAVGWYQAAPVRTGLLPWSAEEVRDRAQLIAETTTRAARLGWRVQIPRAKETLLDRWLVRWQLSHDGTMAIDPFPVLMGGELRLLGERCARVAETYTDPSGPRRNDAFDELVWQCIRVIEARCGAGAAKLGWIYEQGKGSGLLYDVVRELGPWLPGLAGKSTRQVYDMLLDARAVVRKW